MVRSRAFLTLVVSFGLASCTAYVVVVNLVPLLGERGFGPGTAAVVLGIGGVGQVLGRLGYAPLARRLSVRARTVVVLATVAVTTGLLGVLTWLPALVAVAVLAGMVRGIVTLLQATAVTDRWGSHALRRPQRRPRRPAHLHDRGRAVPRGSARRAARRLRHHAGRHGPRRSRRGRPQPRLPASAANHSRAAPVTACERHPPLR